MNRAKLIIPVVLALLNIAAFGINLHEAITADVLARRIASIEFALLSLFVGGLMVVSLRKEYRFRELKRQMEQAPKPQCRCETIIYFKYSGIRIDTVSLLEHEKEYYE